MYQKCSELGVPVVIHMGIKVVRWQWMKYRKEYPFEKLITHKFHLDDGKEAMERSFDPECLKVEFIP